MQILFDFMLIWGFERKQNKFKFYLHFLYCGNPPLAFLPRLLDSNIFFEHKDYTFYCFGRDYTCSKEFILYFFSWLHSQMLAVFLLLTPSLWGGETQASVLVADMTMSRMVELNADAPFCALYTDRSWCHPEHGSRRWPQKGQTNVKQSRNRPRRNV